MAQGLAAARRSRGTDQDTTSSGVMPQRSSRSGIASREAIPCASAARLRGSKGQVGLRLDGSALIRGGIVRQSEALRLHVAHLAAALPEQAEWRMTRRSVAASYMAYMSVQQ